MAEGKGAQARPDLKELLSETTQVLKSMMASSSASAEGSSASAGNELYDSLQRQLDGLKLKALAVKNAATLNRLQFREKLDMPVLIDSGATSILRPAVTEEEYLKADQVSVTLAGGAKTRMRQAPSGTVLANTTDPIQPIIPMSKMVEAGCKVAWAGRDCSITHPRLGALDVRLTELTPEQAKVIIDELEKKYLADMDEGVRTLQAKLTALKQTAVKPWRCFSYGLHLRWKDGARVPGGDGQSGVW